MGVPVQPENGVVSRCCALIPKGVFSTKNSPTLPATNSIMHFSRACLLTGSLVTLSTALPSPATGVLRSQYPEKPIEDPANWAWGQHPRNGLGYNAKDNLELEVCLANPHMIATPKCKIPLDICLDNPEWLPLFGCSGEGLPLQVCLDFPKLLTRPACEANLTPQLCASTPSITRLAACTA